uniref:Uncharacterized protein n=1 Tax=Candidatus Kentrum sp. LFY TaxID=2126342 RepID=A0A450WX37_9GAMM|nr:MAG: hypothetical protein BECKLFY1418C_GA0070996_10975 [Candidatus Kentron sp. LFY]
MVPRGGRASTACFRFASKGAWESAQGGFPSVLREDAPKLEIGRQRNECDAPARAADGAGSGLLVEWEELSPSATGRGWRKPSLPPPLATRNDFAPLADAPVSGIGQPRPRRPIYPCLPAFESPYLDQLIGMVLADLGIADDLPEFLIEEFMRKFISVRPVDFSMGSRKKERQEFRKIVFQCLFPRTVAVIPGRLVFWFMMTSILSSRSTECHADFHRGRRLDVTSSVEAGYMSALLPSLRSTFPLYHGTDRILLVSRSASRLDRILQGTNSGLPSLNHASSVRARASLDIGSSTSLAGMLGGFLTVSFHIFQTSLSEPQASPPGRGYPPGKVSNRVIRPIPATSTPISTARGSPPDDVPGDIPCDVPGPAFVSVHCNGHADSH